VLRQAIDKGKASLPIVPGKGGEGQTVAPNLKGPLTKGPLTKGQITKNPLAKDAISKAAKGKGGLEKLTKDRLPKDKARDLLARDKLGKGALTKDKLSKGQLTKDKLGKDQLTKDKLGKGKLAQDKLGKDKLGKDKLGKDKLGTDKLAKDKLGKDKLGKAGDLKAAKAKAPRQHAVQIARREIPSSAARSVQPSPRDHRCALRLPPRPFGSVGFTGVPPASETRFVSTEMVFHVGLTFRDRPSTQRRNVWSDGRRRTDQRAHGGTLYHWSAAGAAGSECGAVVEAERVGIAAPN
jgi:hypothetical protein